MSMRRPQRGAPLPYRPLAGVIPCGRGWLAATAKLQGITLSPEPPKLFSTLLEVLDYKPAFQVIALGAPIGLLDEPMHGGRSCDRDARRLLGWPRSGAIVSAPARVSLSSDTYAEAAWANGGSLSILSWRLFPKLAEIDANVAPYWQRTVFSVHPELSFYQLNGDHPVRYAKRTRAGLAERRALLEKRLPGIERVLDAQIRGVGRAHLLDAAACLWTARRIIAQTVDRLPLDPEWNTLGLRMEFVR